MSLDVYLTEPDGREVYWRNITHNLNSMAEAAGIYQHLWRPGEVGVETASQLIEPLSVGIGKLLTNPTRMRLHNPENGWGDYEGFVEFVTEYIAACATWPDAKVRVSR